MSYAYEKYTMHERAIMEAEFRRLVSIIPVWRQLELFSMEKDEAEGNLQIHQTNFAEHWNMKTVDWGNENA